MRGGRTYLVWLAIALATALFAVQQHRLTGHVSSDFDIFFDAAQRFLVDAATIYDAGWQADVVSDVATQQGYLYPPPAILAFVPLTWGDRAQAFFTFSWAALAAAILSCWLWMRLLARDGLCTLSRTETAALIGLACVTGPVFINRGGQVGTFILLVCVAGVWLSRGRGRWLGGVALAIGGWIKIYPGLLMLYVIRQPGWPRVATGFALAAIGVPLLSLLLIPVDLYRLYFEQLLPAMSGRAIINIDNQSLHAIWLRSTTAAIDPRTSFVAPEVPAAIGGAIVAMALVSIAAFSWRLRGDDRSALAVAAVVMAWIGPMTPLGWGHSYVYGLPLLMLVLAVAWQRAAWPSLIAALAAWAAIVVPSHHRLGDGVPAFLAQIFYARYPIAMLVLMLVAWRLSCSAALKPSPDRPI